MTDKKPAKTVKGLSATNTYFTEMPTTKLDAARRSMVIVSGNFYSKNPYVGGGVVVRYNERKYLVAASHSTGEIAYRIPDGHKAYWSTGVAYLGELEMKYSVPIAQSSNLPVGDIIIFDFPFNSIEPVELSENLPENPIVAVSLGFPVDAIDLWKHNRLPVARAGLSCLSRRTETSFKPYGTIDLSKFTDEIIAEVLTSGGSSGGGLFDQDGKLLGICRGYKPGNPNLGEFYTVKEIFGALSL